MDRVDYQSLVVQDLLNLEAKGELNVAPWYQRRSVWQNSQKSYLINTIFEKKPIPSLYIRHSLDLEKAINVKEVVDGQQRTRTIISYRNNEFAARHPEYKKLVKFSELSNTQKESFLLTAIPVGYLLGANNADVIDIFARINSVSKTLNEQEKRNALYSGEFKQFCVFEAVKRVEFWKEYKIFSGNEIARMNEVEFISDIVLNITKGLSNFSQPALNKMYEEYDDVFTANDPVEKKLSKIFDLVISVNPQIIKQTIFNRKPIFFSLVLVLNSIPRYNKSKIEKGLIEIDNRFNTDVAKTKRSKEDLNFYDACSATTQGLPNRKIRHNYIKKFIS